MERFLGWIGRWAPALSRSLGGRAILPVLETGDIGGPYRDVEAFRHSIFERYRFTPEARQLLAATRIVIHNMREPVGGGYWYGPRENRVELFGIQDEAAVHELAHAWADHAGFYTEEEPNGPPWKTRNSTFRADVHRVAVENDPAYARIAFLCREYEFGNPDTGFPGMFENDAERFAGLASGSMGDLRLMPPYLRRWYAGLFQSAEASGPSTG